MGLKRRRREAAVSPVDVLFVCTGNICRTPVMAVMLAAGAPDLVVASAGTRAVLGAAASPDSEAVLVQRALTAAGHRARQLTPAVVAAATLVVTATAAQRTEVVRLRPGAADRSFTLKELARLLARADLPAGAGLAAVLAAAAQLGLDGDAAGRGGDDLDDPYGQPRATYERVATEVQAALAPLVRALARSGSASGPCPASRPADVPPDG